MHSASISYTSKTGPFRAACVCGWILKPVAEEADAVRSCWCHERDALLAEVEQFKMEAAAEAHLGTVLADQLAAEKIAHLATWQERDEAQRRLAFATDWYAQRFSALRKWVDAEVRPLSAEVATRYFSICANGSPSPHESADWQGTLHARTLEARVAEGRAARAEKERDAIKAAGKALLTAIDSYLDPEAFDGMDDSKKWNLYVAPAARDFADLVGG